jgi:putative flippase GtrA
VFYFLLQAGMFYLAAGIIAGEVSILTNFTLNSLWTFRPEHDGTFSSIKRPFVKDHLVRAGGE